ncbi:Bys1 family protein [Aspergillus clavatus NRRL 1]|uniref:BYS1 domain protein n=1 Tax=Aspergillus clavatus (strain ATCC 1007 / CBS 513.65 / DSM 816 / NCTC 3887 / NRRL 1 / QM 1276 / 107) TaxID=344612 RepID=A1CEL5_ASPCL|nr:uncharacterized protein ACLA_090070 [Aspergillus clavatus NRRL 1]EAW11314.1 conserved hypothetical protein [Aspergillus clavatus NRRL 1]
MHFHFNLHLSTLLPLLLPLTTALTLLPPPTTNQTLGHAIVQNNCPDPIYLWSVGSAISPQTTLMSGTHYAEVFRRDPHSGGVAIKLTTQRDGLYRAAPQTIFAYNLVERTVWYDLSDVFGDPFAGRRVRLEPAVPEISWADGVPPRGNGLDRSFGGREYEDEDGDVVVSS